MLAAVIAVLNVTEIASTAGSAESDALDLDKGRSSNAN